MTGYTDGSFQPNKTITRAEFATIISKFNQIEGSSNFTDVASSHWAAGYIGSAASQGWITGYSDGTYRPNNDITRAEAVTAINNMLDRGIEKEDIPEGVASYSDLKESHWAYCGIIEASNEHEYERKSNGYELWLD